MQSGDQRQDFGEQPAGHRDLGELERDVSAVTDDLRADFDQLFRASWSATIFPSSLCVFEARALMTERYKMLIEQFRTKRLRAARLASTHLLAELLTMHRDAWLMATIGGVRSPEVT